MSENKRPHIEPHILKDRKSFKEWCAASEPPSTVTHHPKSTSASIAIYAPGNNPCEGMEHPVVASDIILVPEYSKLGPADIGVLARRAIEAYQARQERL